MAEDKIARMMSERRQLADKAAVLGQQVLHLREAKAVWEQTTQKCDTLQSEVLSLQQAVAANAQEITSLQQLLAEREHTITSLQRTVNAQRQEIAMLKSSRLLRMGRKLRQLFQLPTWN